jgi:hypothetical protein
MAIPTFDQGKRHRADFVTISARFRVGCKRAVGVVHETAARLTGKDGRLRSSRNLRQKQ